MNLHTIKVFKEKNWTILFLLVFLIFNATEIYGQDGIRIYGHQIFKADYKINSDKRQNDSTKAFVVKIPDSYILGQGDKLTVSIFGESQFDAQLEVNQRGYIQPNRLPKVFLKGLTWGKAKKLIQSRFNQFYSFNSDQFAVSLSQPRTITVNIFGEVENPGSFTLSAANTAFNALIAAGGVSESASVRNIKVISDGEQKKLDLYEFMINPSTQFQLYLEDNMIIQVPAAQKIVQIGGAVQRPMKYELKGTEGLKELIQYAGGLRADALKEVVQIKRFSSSEQALLDINWQQLSIQNRNYALQNGDMITIKAIPKSIDNTVTIEGAVELPGAYAIESTQNISALLRKGILKREARLDVAFLQRANSDGTKKLIQLDLNGILNNTGSAADLVLKPDDKLLIYEQERYVDKTIIKVSGAVRSAIEYPFDPDSTITIQQAILLAGGLAQEATDFAYLIRVNPNNSDEKEYERINIKAALDNPRSKANLKLQPQDELVVLTTSDYTDKSSVAIRGAVRSPGKFQYDASLKIKDLLTLAGGFELQAARNRLDVFRLEIIDNQPTKMNVLTLQLDDAYNVIGGAAKGFTLMPFDEVVVRTVPDFEMQTFVKVTGEVVYPGEYALTSKNELLSSLVKRSGGLSPAAFPEGATIYRIENKQGFVVTKLEEVLRNEKSKYNYILKAGDVINIPKKKDLVTINLNNTKAKELYAEKFTTIGQIGVAFEPSKSAKWYINEYTAGFGIDAAKKSVTVEYPNGAIKRTKNLGLFNIYPKLEKGGIISIGAKQLKSKKEMQSKKDDRLLKIYPKLKKGTVITIGTEQEEKETKPLKEEEVNKN